MTSNNNNWIADTVGDFIHSPIWAAPIQTFIDANCAAFDYDDDEITEEESAASLAISVEEQMNIHEKYQRLVNALIDCLGNDLSLDKNELNKVCQLPTIICCKRFSIISRNDEKKKFNSSITSTC
jgi:hypothetical protein